MCVCVRRDVCAYSPLPDCTNATVPHVCALLHASFISHYNSVTRWSVPQGGLCYKSSQLRLWKFALLTDLAITNIARFHLRHPPLGSFP